MLNSAPFSEPASRKQMTDRFAALGIEDARLELLHTSPQPRTWAAYGQVDIALDPFPHNAGTTTIEALWQGVPVLSLAGRPTVGRFGAAILRAIRLDDWVTNDIDAYVARAVTAAADIDALARLRGGLRARFAASPLRDAAGLAREMEAAYRALWRRWCEAGSRDVRQIYAAGDAEGARRLAEQLLRRDPNSAAALHVLGLIKFNQGDATTAADLLHRSLETATDAGVLSDLGVMLRTVGRLTEAETAYRHALELDPCLRGGVRKPAEICTAGSASRRRSRTGSDRAHFARRRISHALLRSLALCQMSRGAADQAGAALGTAVAMDTVDGSVHDTLGALLGQSGRPIEAEAHHRIALSRTKQPAPRSVQSCDCPAGPEQTCRSRTMLPRRARRAARLPRRAQQSALSLSIYRNDLSGQQYLPIRCVGPPACCCARAAKTPDRRRPVDARRRLRVGYVFADFRQHPVAWFAEPHLAAHDRSCIEVFSMRRSPHLMLSQRGSARLSNTGATSSTWSGAAVADLIRRDGIDVLVDVTRHMSAAVCWSSHAGRPPCRSTVCWGTGTPRAFPRWMPSWRMRCWLRPALMGCSASALYGCHASLWHMHRRMRCRPLLRFQHLPMASSPSGISDERMRLNDAVIATWARILHDVPAARLVLNSLPYREPAFRDLIARRFATQGVDRGRLELIATAPQPVTCQRYGAIDIALDPFLDNAGTTTIEALWQERLLSRWQDARASDGSER